MTFIKLQFKPGVNRDQTSYSSEGGWYQCNLVRFRSGFPEKIGGWQSINPNTGYYGVCRQMWNWATTYSENLLAMGTNNKLYIEDSGGNFYDITPIASTFTGTNTNNSINTTSGSNVVTVTMGTSYGSVTPNSFTVISGVAGTTIGGIPVSQINGTQELTTINSTAFSFPTTTNATSTTTGQGGTSINISFQIAPGYAATTQGTGWGVGGWGATGSGWGLGATSGGVNLQQQDWFLNNFYNDLVANVRNGAIYYWSRGSGSISSALASPAITLKQVATNQGSANYVANAVPDLAMQTMVAQQYGFVLAFGATPYYNSGSPPPFDPMLIRWSDQSNPSQWTPGFLADGVTYSAAGYIRVSRGSKIIAALPTVQQILVWTDQALYGLQYTGTTAVFALQEYADNVTCISPRCMVTAGSVVYWMGRDKFYAYTGIVETLPCTLRDYIFNDLNWAQSDQIICGTNEEWNEIWWYYPSASSGLNWNDSYVIYNYLERIWYYGKLGRTAWLDTPSRQYPQGAYTAPNLTNSSSGFLYNHELGVDADGTAMNSYIQSSDFDLDDGEQFVLARRLLPDVSFNGSTNNTPQVTISMAFRNFPGDSQTLNPENSTTVTAVNVSPYTEQVFIRERGRQLTFQIGSATLGSQWQMGAPRLDARADGKR